MKLALKRVFALVLTLTMLFTGVLSASAKKVSQSDINNMNSQIASTQAEINRLNGNRNEIRDKQKEIAEQLKQLEKETAKVEDLKLLLDMQIEYLTEEIITTENIIFQCQNDIALKTEMIESTKKELEEKEALFIEFFRNNYEQGSTKLKYIEILLTSRSISDFILNVQYIGSILDYEQYLLDSTENLIATYKSQVSDLEKMYALNSENFAALDETKENVSKLSSEAAGYILQLMKDEEKALALEEEMKKAEADAAYSIQEQAQRKNIEIETENANIAKAEKEAELAAQRIAIKERELDANIRKQADAMKYKMEREAEADLIRRTKEAEASRVEAEQAALAKKAEAEAMKYAMLQEAEGIAAKGKAEAEAIEKKAEAQKKMGEASVLEMYFAALPEIVKNAAEPLSKTDKIVMYGDGNSTKLMKDVMGSTSQIFEGVKEATGLDMQSMISGFVGGKAAAKSDEE